MILLTCSHTPSFGGVFQQATTTVTTVASGQSDTSLVALIALILGIVSTALSVPLAMLTIRDYFGRKSKARLELLAPKLREIRDLLIPLYAPAGVARGPVLKNYLKAMNDFKGKGYWHVDLAKIDPKLMEVFDALHDGVIELHKNAKGRFNDDQQIEAYIIANIKRDQVIAVIDRIDKLLDKAAGA